MQVQREKEKFDPIAVRIQTQHELQMMVAVLERAKDDADVDSDEWDFAQILLDALKKAATGGR